MEGILYNVIALIFALVAVYSYRLGLRDGMNKNAGQPPVFREEKPREETAAELEQKKISEAVESFK